MQSAADLDCMLNSELCTLQQTSVHIMHDNMKNKATAYAIQ